VTGSNGIIVPPDDYWPRVREICDKHGILLISDEVMSGWGRTDLRTLEREAVALALARLGGQRG
jgi:adenosylmethionine-8-amino-7-oxononanoate aminotransferase